MKKLLFTAVVVGSFLFVGAGAALATSITDPWIDPAGNILMNNGSTVNNIVGKTDYQYYHYISPPFDVGIDTLTSAILTISLTDAGSGNSFKYGLDLTGIGFDSGAIQVNGDYELNTAEGDWDISLLNDGILKVNIHRQAGTFYFVESSLFAEWTDGTKPPELTVGAVPEPATMFLFGTGLVGLAGAVRRRKKK